MPRIPASQKKRKPKPIDNLPPAPEDNPIEDIPPAPPATVATIEPPEPAKPKPSPLPASSLVQDEIQRSRRLAEAREELLFRRHFLLAEGADLTVDEMRILQSEVPRSSGDNDFAYKTRFRKFLDRENTRVERILTLQAVAGTPDDRLEADKAAEAAKAKLEADGPEIEQEIRALQTKLERLWQEAEGAKSTAEAKHAAATSLQQKDFLPSFVRDDMAALDRDNTDDFGKELLNLESRQSQIEGLLAIDVTTPEGREKVKRHVSGNKRFAGDELTRIEQFFHCEKSQTWGGVAHRFRRFRTDRWEAYLAELRQELNAVKSRTAEIEAGPQAEAEAKLQKLREYYLPG